MIRLIDVFKSVLLTLVFIISLRYIETHIEYLSHSQTHKARRPSHLKYKISTTVLITLLLIAIVYNFECRNKPQPEGPIALLQCIYINPNKELARDVAIALFINTTLFLGGLHQELYNGRIRRKFMRFYKKEFQWNLFKRLFIVPVCLEIVYRALICRILDPKLDHPSFFTLFSGLIYAFSHSISYFPLRKKFSTPFATKALLIHIGYNLVFGLYVSHIFAKSSTLISSLVLQVYANFMGYPEYFQVLKGNMHDDRIRKTAIFYLCGVVGCLSCCLFL